MHNDYDILIIGSGLGGLVCGYILSKNGLKMAILEKQPVLGGCLQSFVRQDVRFETGMHYIGSIRPGEALHRFFSYLDLLKDLQLDMLDRDGYDIISCRGDRYAFANGREAFVETLARKFPHEQQNLQRYMETIRQIGQSSPLYSFSHFDSINLLSPEYVKVSVNESVEGIVKDPVLQEVLVGNLPLYAGRRDHTPMYVHALISDFYNHSAARIVGGSDAIAQSLATSVQRHGGACFTSQRVIAVDCDSEKAVAVRTASGERFTARYIVSDIHPELLIDMIDSHLFRHAYKERIRSMQQTVSNFTVYLKFKPGCMPYRRHNFFHYKKDVWNCEDYTPADWPRNFLYMHQAAEPQARWARNAVLIAYMRWDEVQQWADTTLHHRGRSYEEFKQHKAELLLDALERELPGTKAAIEAYWTSTPLTYRDYTGTKEGSMYGIMRDKNFPTQTLVTQRTKIPNLFLTGQNINSHGILGVIIGAILTCSEIIGADTIIRQIQQHN